jgi:hypothetical protein
MVADWFRFFLRPCWFEEPWAASAATINNIISTVYIHNSFIVNNNFHCYF